MSSLFSNGRIRRSHGVLPERIEIKSSTAQTWLIVVAFAYAPLASFVSGVFHHLPIIGSFSNYVVPAIIVLLVLLNLHNINKIFTSHDVIAGFLFLLFIFLSYIFNVANRENITNNLGGLFFGSIPYYVVGLLWKDDRKTMYQIFCTSIFAIIINVLYLGLVMSQRDFSYSMSTSYGCLPSIMVCLWWALFEKSKVGMGAACLGFLFLIFLGTRGPLVVFLVYTCIILWNNVRTKGKALLLVVFGSLIYLVVFTKTLNTISVYLASFARSMGLSTRIFDILNTSSFFGYTSGRDVFYETVNWMIKERPFLGYGIYGEWQYLHNPAHRIWLEIWCHFGVIIGTFLMLYMIYTVFRGLKYSQNIYIKNFILIWAIHLMVRGIFGSTYLDYYSFFLWGLCNNQIRAKKHVAL